MGVSGPVEDAAGVIPSTMANQLTRIGERVAQLDGRVTSDIAALKQDTQSIRAAMHDQNNTMQRFVAAEMQCAAGLATLTERVTQLAAQITPLAASVADLGAARHRVEGGWIAFAKMIGAIGFIGSGIGAAVTVMVYLLKNFTIRGGP